MAVAAKVIGAVRLGLVDIKDVIQELNSEEMQQDPEIRMLLQESLLHSYMPSHNSKFAVEKTKPRSMSSVSKWTFATFVIQCGSGQEPPTRNQFLTNETCLLFAIQPFKYFSVAIVLLRG